MDYLNATTTLLPDVNNSTAEHSDGYEPFYNNAQFITGLIVLPILCLLGIVGNIVTLIVINQKTMRTSTNAYLSALSVADTIKLLNDVLYFITILLLNTAPEAGNKVYGYIYPYAHFIFSISTCISSWLTVSVAVERYIMVCYATYARQICTLQRAKIVSGSIYFIMIAIASPSAIRYRTIQKFDNVTNMTILDVEVTALWDDNPTFVTVFNWSQNLLRSIVPLCILLVLNFKIIGALNKSRANKKMAQRNRITVMLISVIIMFIICVTPDAIMSIVGVGYHDESNHLVKGIREITDMLLAVNAAANFILYFVFNSIFRQCFLTIFCKRKLDNKVEMDESQYRKIPDASPNSNETNNTNNAVTTPLKENSTNSTQL